MDDMVSLQVSGQRYGGWKSISINRAVERVAADFQLSVSERWTGVNVARGIKSGDSCRVYIGGDLVLSGYVDSVAISYDAGMPRPAV